MSKKYLVTGGAGFIGTNLVERLISEGNQVVVVDDLSGGDNQARLPKEVNFNKLSICETDELTKLCDGVDVVVHLAALPRVQFSIDEPLKTHEANVSGTLSVLEAARSGGVKRVVFAASSSAYGDQEKLPLTPDMPPQPKSPYAMHKYFGEEMLKVWQTIYGLETVSLRFFNVYGPHLDPEGAYALVIGRFLKLTKEGKPLTIYGDGEQSRDFTHVSDVVDAVVRASVSDRVGKGEVLNVGRGDNASVNTLAKMISDNIEYKEPRIEPKHTMADVTLTRELLGWEPKIDLVDGVNALKKDFGLED